jgi:demethoxyubiquinone hydroxylase (CLK1/Coq7/Cat5 family)
MEKEHSMELNRIHLDITQMKQQHTLQFEQIESHFNVKLLYEFQKYDELRQKIEKMKDDHERYVEQPPIRFDFDSL